MAFGEIKGTGSGGGRRVHLVSGSPFVDEAARDLWANANVAELFNNTETVSVAVVGTDTEEWAGVDTPTSYISTHWIAYTNLSSETIKTLYESNSNTNALVDTKRNVLDDLSIVDNRIVSSKAFEVPPGTIYIGKSTSLSAAIRAVHLRSDVTGNKALILSQLYDSNGFAKAAAFAGDAEESLNIITPGTDQADAANFKLTSSEDELVTRLIIDTANINQVVDFSLIIRTESFLGPIAFDLQGELVTNAQGKAVINLSDDYNPVLVDSGTELFINAVCVNMIGDANTPEGFIPNTLLTRIVTSRDEISLTKDVQSLLDAVDDVKEPTGFVDRTTSSLTITNDVVSLDAIGECVYYIRGVRYSFTGSKGVTISAVEGIRFIYIDSDKVMQQTTSFDLDTIFKDNAYVAVIYWDAVNSKSIYLGDERHGATMDWATHEYLHNTFGTRFVSGLGLDSFVIGDGSSDTHAQFAYSSGIIKDEDIQFNILADNSPCQIPIYYKEGVNVRIKEANDFPLIGKDDITSTTRPKYNENVAGVWQLTELPQNGLWLIHYFATNDVNRPVIGWLGTDVYSNATQARLGAESEINNLTGLPFAEFTSIGTVIFQTDGLGNIPNAKIVQFETGVNYVDFRGDVFTGTSGGIAPTDHQNLTSRSVSSCHPASSISYDNTASGYTATEIQSAVDESASEISSHVTSASAHSAEYITYDSTGNPVSSATNVKTGVDNVGVAVNDHMLDTVDAHDSTAIGFTSTTGLLSTDSGTAIDEVNQDMIDVTDTINASLTNHIDGTVGEHEATAIATNDLAWAQLEGVNAQLALDSADSKLNAHFSSTTAHDIEVNNLTQYFFVDENGVDLDNTDGSIKKPFASLSTAISKVVAGDNSVIELGKGTFSGNISSLSKSNVMIKGQAVNGSYNTTYAGRIDADTPMSRLRMKDISIVSPENEALNLQSSDNGRHLFDNVFFASIQSSTLILISGMSNECTFKDCSIGGRITFGSSSGDIYIIGNTNSNLEIVNNANGNIYVVDSVCSSITNNGAGTVFISNSKTDDGAVIPEVGTGTIVQNVDPYLVVELLKYAQKDSANTFSATNTFDGLTNFNGNIDALSSSDIRLGAGDKLRVDSDGVKTGDNLYLKELSTPDAISGYSSITPTAGELIVSRRSNGDTAHFDAWRLRFLNSLATAKHYDKIFADSSTAAFTINLPSARIPGLSVLINEHIGGNILTINGNGSNIEIYDSAGSLVATDTTVITTQNRKFEFVATLTAWRLNI